MSSVRPDYLVAEIVAATVALLEIAIHAVRAITLQAPAEHSGS
jgi:hypothetical protein